MSRITMLALAALVSLALTACYEDTTPTRYEPGVYKGSEDPLLDKLESEELRSELDQRFERVAADR